MEEKRSFKWGLTPRNLYNNKENLWSSSSNWIFKRMFSLSLFHSAVGIKFLHPFYIFYLFTQNSLFHNAEFLQTKNLWEFILWYICYTYSTESVAFTSFPERWQWYHHRREKGTLHSATEIVFHKKGKKKKIQNGGKIA